jgi:2-succinyl-5-enolpyruvyl-6-hydroxy-3-cyclohexene-1-carboxylate synthase
LTYPNPSTALATVVVDELARNGVTRGVASPGSRSAALAMALETDGRMNLTIALDERAGGFFALGLGKLGIPAVVLTTSGTAAANLFPAVIEAEASGVPLLLLTADRPPELRQAGANQTIDQVKLFGDHVRWFCELGPGADHPTEAPHWRSSISRAVAVARGGDGGRPGPVHLNLPFREPLVPVSDDGRSRADEYRSPTAGREDGSPWTEFQPAASSPVEIEVSGRVAVVLGDEGSPTLASEALTAGAVVIAEGHSGGRIPGTVSTSHHLLASPELAADTLPDVVVRVGRTGLSPNLARWLAGCPQQVVVSRGFPDPQRTAGRWVPAVRFRPGAPDEGWAHRWAEAEASARAVIDELLDSRLEVSEPRLARDVAAAVPAGGVLVVGSSMPVRDLDWFMAPRGDLQVVANRGASGIDGLLATGAGVASSGRATTVLTGDLGLLHDFNGLLMDPRPDLTVVVASNNGGAIFSFLPQAAYPETFQRLFATPHHVSLQALAAAIGAGYHLVGSAAEIGGLVGSAAAPGPAIVEAVTDRDDNVDLHRSLTAAVVEAVSRQG